MNKQTKEVLVYACGYCSKLYRKKEQADLCHMDRTCGKCGKVIGKKDYYTNCEECRLIINKEKEDKLFTDAIKMNYLEYEKKYPGYPICIGDEYFYDIDSVLDNIDEYGQCRVWGTTSCEITIDASSIAETFEEETTIEDYEMGTEAISDLVDMCKKWNKKNSEVVYLYNDNIAILIER